MASRKEQKEQLRKQREEREAAAKTAERRRRLVGYGAAGALVAAVLVVLVVVLLAGGDGNGKTGSGDFLPSGGKVPEPKTTDLTAAAKAAGCQLKSFRAKSRDHTEDLSGKITYDSNPPTEGNHYVVPADDGSYETAPDAKELVHSLEHGRIVIWVRPTLPKPQRADLKALYDEDPFQMIITPDPTKMPYAAAASAWNADPTPLGTGRLLGCPTYNDKIFDAIRAFKDEHRSNGPETVQ